MSVTLITLRIRNFENKQVDGPAEEEKGTRLALQLIEAATGAVIEETIPPDLKIPGHVGDYSTYRDFFIKEAGEKPEFGEMGRHLFALLHIGKVGKRWNELIKGKKPDENVRVLLDMDAVAENDQDLALLPWELISKGGDHCFQDTEDSIIRVHNYGDEEDPKIEPINWPIRLLIVVGVHDKSIGAAEEVERIEDVMRDVNRLIDVDVIETPTINQLEAKCKQFKPHVFHYIGHGAVDPVDPSKTSYIFLTNAAGKNDPWSATQIGTSLKAWKWFPRFVFINACRTAASKTATLESQIAAWGIGDAFRTLKIPAVLTMQADIRGALAGEFAGEVYARLASGESIDRAIAGARVRVRDNTQALAKNNTRDWATPMLTLCMPPENVLPLKLKTSKEREADIKLCEKFQEVSVLANCRDDRRKFIHGFYPIPPDTPDKEMILVRGSKASGKTWITLWCLEGCARQNHDVRYVEVVSGKSPKWLDVLTQIQAGDKSKSIGGRYELIYRPLNPAAFNEFNHELRYRIKNETPPAWDGSNVPFEELDAKELDNLPENTVKDIFKSFRKALLLAAEVDTPLIIVLDQLTYKGNRVSDGHMERFLIPYLFEQAAVGNLKSPDGSRAVKFVVIINDEELNQIYPELNKLKMYWHEVSLEGIPAADYEKVVREFFRNLKAAPRSDIQRLFKDVPPNEEQTWINMFARKTQVGEFWKPSVLGELRDSLEYVLRKLNP